VLAIPGRERDVTFFERGTWTELEDFRLLSPDAADADADAAAADKSAKKGHTDNVVLIAWSPNGKYLLTSGKDCVVAVWDVGAKRVIARLAHESIVCGASWKGEGNAVVGALYKLMNSVRPIA
jgi:chromosome transmission fidelity protein 4